MSKGAVGHVSGERRSLQCAHSPQLMKAIKVKVLIPACCGAQIVDAVGAKSRLPLAREWLAEQLGGRHTTAASDSFPSKVTGAPRHCAHEPSGTRLLSGFF